MPIARTDIIAPVEAIATRPKLSSSEAMLSFFNEEIPAESASTNGTVRAPVVAPDASKDTDKNSGDENNANTNINV